MTSDAQQSTDSSAGPSATGRLSGGRRSIRVPLRVMLDVQDELTDLAAALSCLMEIRSLLRVIGEVVKPAEASGGKPSADRIGTTAAELFEGSLDGYLTDSAWALHRQIDTAVPRRDHSFRVPRPDLSVKLGTPNACNDYHRDRSPQWAGEAVIAWYGSEPTENLLDCVPIGGTSCVGEALSNRPPVFLHGHWRSLLLQS